MLVQGASAVALSGKRNGRGREVSNEVLPPTPGNVVGSGGLVEDLADEGLPR